MIDDFMSVEIFNAKPIAENVTLNGLKGCGLSVGDIIRVNNITHVKIVKFIFVRDSIEVLTAKGNKITIKSSNVIDLIH